MSEDESSNLCIKFFSSNTCTATICLQSLFVLVTYTYRLVGGGEPGREARVNVILFSHLNSS